MDLAVLTTGDPVEILVVNAGSSSLKLRLLDEEDTVLASRDLPAVDALATGDLESAVEQISRDGWPIKAVGHRIVHGGTVYTQAVRVDADVRHKLEDLTELAPLHQPKSLAALDAVSAARPDLPAVACFDTAFHATLPPAAATYAVPREWQQRYSVRRYGFHGLSHAYCVRRAVQLLGREPTGLRMVTCHLGAGASLAAVVDGHCVDTTMGFTPLEGLVMATRSGSVDPGLLLWLEEHEGLQPHDVATALETQSGLLALAGTADMREVQVRAMRGDPGAQLALDVFIHRLVLGIGAMAAAAGGLDVLAFTGGIGERSPIVRDRAAERLAHLGVQIDGERNETARRDMDVSTEAAIVRTVVIAAREDVQIAGETRAVLAGDRS